jgi:hypothetical protein
VTVAGWIVMILAVGGMTGLLIWCVYKVISTPGASSHLHSQVDIDTRDRD